MIPQAVNFISSTMEQSPTDFPLAHLFHITEIYLVVLDSLFNNDPTKMKRVQGFGQKLVIKLLKTRVAIVLTSLMKKSN